MSATTKGGLRTAQLPGPNRAEAVAGAIDAATWFPGRAALDARLAGLTIDEVLDACLLAGVNLAMKLAAEKIAVAVQSGMVPAAHAEFIVLQFVGRLCKTAYGQADQVTVLVRDARPLAAKETGK